MGHRGLEPCVSKLTLEVSGEYSRAFLHLPGYVIRLKSDGNAETSACASP